MTKIEVPHEISSAVSEQAAQRNGDKPRAGAKDQGQAKRLDSLVEGVTRNLFSILTEAKKRQDYALALQTVDRLVQVAELEARRLEGSGHA